MKTVEKSKAKELVDELGLSEYWEKIGDVLKPSIHLTAEELTRDTVFTTGRSRLGGQPDLPQGIQWPELNNIPQSFVAQVNFKEIKPLMTGYDLPSTGMLYFFFNAQQEAMGFEPGDAGGFKVIYADVPASELSKRDYPGALPEHCRYAGAEVNFAAFFSIPYDETGVTVNLGMGEHEHEAYVTMLDEIEGIEPDHRMFGHIHFIQDMDLLRVCRMVNEGISCAGDPYEHDLMLRGLDKESRDWVLLFQVDTHTDLGMMWGDTGMLYYFIREEDLKNHRFDKTWAIMESL